MEQEYRVQLDVFSGPLDLLLYLIKRDELDIQDISLVKVADQYIEYARMLEQLDPNTAGDFLVLAATLVEIKSRALLPTAPIEDMEEDEDPRATLVRELLEYKRFKDAAQSLGTSADERAKRHVRRPPPPPKEVQGVELEDVELWDLVSAFGRVMTSIGAGPSLHEVTKDDHPIEFWAGHLVRRLDRDAPVEFDNLFEDRRNRAQVVGLFLALLELLRGQHVRAQQEANFGRIFVFLLVEPEEAIIRLSTRIQEQEAEEPTARETEESEEAEYDEEPLEETADGQAERESDAAGTDAAADG